MTSLAEYSNERYDSVKKLDPEGYYRAFIKNRIRPDGRHFNQFRSIVDQSEQFSSRITDNNAAGQRLYGSSLIRVGGTVAAAGIQLFIGTPNATSPESGEIGLHSCMHAIHYLSCLYKSLSNSFFLFFSFLLDFDVTLGSLSSPQYDQRGKSSEAYRIESMLMDIFNK